MVSKECCTCLLSECFAQTSSLGSLWCLRVWQNKAVSAHLFYPKLAFDRYMEPPNPHAHGWPRNLVHPHGHDTPSFRCQRGFTAAGSFPCWQGLGWSWKFLCHVYEKEANRHLAAGSQRWSTLSSKLFQWGTLQRTSCRVARDEDCGETLKSDAGCRRFISHRICEMWRCKKEWYPGFWNNSHLQHTLSTNLWHRFCFQW